MAQTSLHASSATESARLTTPVFSVVTPVFNEAEILPVLYDRLKAVLDDLDEPWEIVLINDGSRDGSLDIMRSLVGRDARVRVVDLSRNFGHQAAITAGMAAASGQAIIIIDADLQDPPEVIPEMIAQWRAGAEVVYAQRAARAGETWFKRHSASLFYRVLRRVTAVNIPRDTGDFRLVDRRVVNVMNALPEHHRFMRGLSAWVGFRQVAVLYDRQETLRGQNQISPHENDPPLTGCRDELQLRPVAACHHHRLHPGRHQPGRDHRRDHLAPGK